MSSTFRQPMTVLQATLAPKLSVEHGCVLPRLYRIRCPRRIVVSRLLRSRMFAQCIILYGVAVRPRALLQPERSRSKLATSVDEEIQPSLGKRQDYQTGLREPSTSSLDNVLERSSSGIISTAASQCPATLTTMKIDNLLHRARSRTVTHR